MIRRIHFDCPRAAEPFEAVAPFSLLSLTTVRANEAMVSLPLRLPQSSPFGGELERARGTLRPTSATHTIQFSKTSTRALRGYQIAVSRVLVKRRFTPSASLRRAVRLWRGVVFPSAVERLSLWHPVTTEPFGPTVKLASTSPSREGEKCFLERGHLPLPGTPRGKGHSAASPPLRKPTASFRTTSVVPRNEAQCQMTGGHPNRRRPDNFCSTTQPAGTFHGLRPSHR